MTALKLHRKVDIDLVVEVESDRNRPASIEVNAGIDAIPSPSKDECKTKDCEEV